MNRVYHLCGNEPREPLVPYYGYSLAVAERVARSSMCDDYIRDAHNFTHLVDRADRMLLRVATDYNAADKMTPFPVLGWNADAIKAAELVRFRARTRLLVTLDNELRGQYESTWQRWLSRKLEDFCTDLFCNPKLDCVIHWVDFGKVLEYRQKYDVRHELGMNINDLVASYRSAMMRAMFFTAGRLGPAFQYYGGLVNLEKDPRYA